MAERAYAVEIVECPSCDGVGEVFWEVYSRCVSCFGSGQVEVCANCLDWDETCSVCAAAVSRSESKKEDNDG